MKRLRDKETGQVFETIQPVLGGDGMSIAELNEKWEDVPEEPEEYWFIDAFGNVAHNIITKHSGDAYTDMSSDYESQKRIGNRFETEEEAERAVEKLKAFTRLEDKGFRFDGWKDLQAEMGVDDLGLFNRDVLDTDNIIGFRMDDYHDCIKDLNICFGGEE